MSWLIYENRPPEAREELKTFEDHNQAVQEAKKICKDRGLEYRREELPGTIVAEIEPNEYFLCLRRLEDNES